MIRKYPIFLLMLLVLLAGACSTTEKISDGEQLYVGIKSTKYHRETAEAKDKTAVQAFSTAKEEQVEIVETTFASTKVTGKKTQNGITIYVPMNYYMQILQMKMETGMC